MKMNTALVGISFAYSTLLVSLLGVCIVDKLNWEGNINTSPSTADDWDSVNKHIEEAGLIIGLQLDP